MIHSHHTEPGARAERRFTRALACLLAAGGCSASHDINGLPVGMPDLAPAGMTQAVQVQATGSLRGTFPGILRAVWNEPVYKSLTHVTVTTPSNPGLGIQSFSLEAMLVGMPRETHYDERVAQITASLVLGSGSQLESNVNSMNRIDLTSVGATETRGDGSVLFGIHGTLAGSVTSSTTFETVFFSACTDC